MKAIKEKAMSNETDLDWLARNVHEWPGEKTYKIGHKLFVGGAQFHEHWASYVSPVSGALVKLNKYHWLARRAELQNKPSWEGAPEWAELLAQDDSGEWYWYASKTAHPGMKNWWPAPGANNVQCGKGEVLGDWRDTLEKRPEEFQPFTSIEDNQEKVMAQQQEMKQDNGWFERGELPPVGGRCVLHAAENNGEEVMFIGVTSDSCPVFETAQKRVFVERGEYMFTPIRNERDVLIEIIKKTDDTDDRIADAILAFGFSLRAK